MKVSEAIDRLKVGDTVWAKLKADGFDNIGAHLKVESLVDYDYMWLREEDEISLTEPKNEKVEVTEKQAELLRAFKGESIFELLANCLGEDEELMAKAKLFGYIVKPKRWVVRQDGSEVLYLQGFSSLDGDIVKQWYIHEGCIKFTDKAKAEAVATLVEGSVEEV